MKTFKSGFKCNPCTLSNYLLLVFFLSFTLLSCSKTNAPDLFKDSSGNLLISPQSNIKPGDIVKYLQAGSSASTPRKNAFIQKILQHLRFDKMYVEALHEKENLIIVPLENVYFSQHVNEKNLHPFQYLLLVEDANGKIRRGDVVLFNAANASLTALPGNAFHDFFNKDTFPADGTFTVITLGDVKEFEMDFKAGKKAQFRVWHGKKNGTNKDGLYCTYWYLVTTTYWADGHTEVNVEYLGPSCSTCAPNQLCDHLDGDGGGMPGEQGIPVSRPVNFIVREENTSYEQWKITGYFTLQGIKFANAGNNVFTDITSNDALCEWFNDEVTQNPISSRYIIFTSSHSEGLVNNTTASATVVGHMYYPNWPQIHGGPKTDNYSLSHAWQASIELY
jgi:hypothetical protein